jgi:hypothetical protein
MAAVSGTVVLVFPVLSTSAQTLGVLSFEEYNAASQLCTLEERRTAYLKLVSKSHAAKNRQYGYCDWELIWSTATAGECINVDAHIASAALSDQIAMNEQIANVFTETIRGGKASGDEDSKDIERNRRFELAYPGDMAPTAYVLESSKMMSLALVSARHIASAALHKPSFDEFAFHGSGSGTWSRELVPRLYACVLLHAGRYCGHAYTWLAHTVQRDESICVFAGVRAAIDYRLIDCPAGPASLCLIEGMRAFALANRAHFLKLPGAHANKSTTAALLRLLDFKHAENDKMQQRLMVQPYHSPFDSVLSDTGACYWREALSLFTQPTDCRVILTN